MGMLTRFERASLPEKILMLDETERSRRVDAIPDLMALFRSEDLDGAVEHAVGETLRALLALSERDTVAGLGADHPKIRRTCIQVAAQQSFASATPELLRIASRETDPDLLLQTLSALAARNPPGAREIYRRCLHHDDPLVAAVAAEALGALGDVESIEALCRIVEDAESEGRFDACDVVTEKAIEALASLGTDAAVSFLVAKIHHRNPTARRFIQQGLLEIGGRAIPFVARLFDQDDVDEQILAANLIGLIGDRRGGDVLVEVFDRKGSNHPNLRFAVYEALGNLPSLKGLVCLMDGLAEDDPMLLMGVVSALDRQLAPAVVARVRAVLVGGGPAADRLVQALVSARAVRLFEALYEDAAIAEEMVSRIRLSNDPDVISVFRETLGAMGERAKSDADRLDPSRIRKGTKRLLAVDDSRSMLLFYKSIGAEMEIEVVTAVNGKEALDLVEDGQPFDLIITDLNMPVMDGIEFTRKARSGLFAQETPILMATTESEAAQRMLAENAGVTGFVPKPIRPEVLKLAVLSHV